MELQAAGDLHGELLGLLGLGFWFRVCWGLRAVWWLGLVMLKCPS